MSTTKFAHTLSVYRAVAKSVHLHYFAKILPIIAHFTFYFVQFANLHFFVYFLTNFVHFALVACVNAFMHISGEEVYKLLRLLNFMCSGPLGVESIVQKYLVGQLADLPSCRLGSGYLKS